VIVCSGGLEIELLEKQTHRARGHGNEPEATAAFSPQNAENCWTSRKIPPPQLWSELKFLNEILIFLSREKWKAQKIRHTTALGIK
jgi:hypothetical protein